MAGRWACRRPGRPVQALRDGLPPHRSAGDAGLAAASPRTATLSFVTDEVDGWYAYLKAAGLAMRSELKDASRHPTRGFVAVDPEGYLLEFERFLDDPQNSRLIGTLANARRSGLRRTAGRRGRRT